MIHDIYLLQVPVIFCGYKIGVNMKIYKNFFKISIIFLICFMFCNVVSAEDNVDNGILANDNGTNLEEYDIVNDEYNDNFDSNISSSLSVNNMTSNNITVSGNRTIVYELYGQDLTKYYGNPQKFSVRLIDISGNPISGKSIKFTINGLNYNRTTNTYGIAQLAINLNSNDYTINYFFFDADNNNYYYGSNLIRILSTISENDIVKYYKNGTQYLATFRDTSGNLLTNTAVTFNINGVIYTRTTNSNGVGQLNINLDPGTYIITATNPINNEQHSNTITVLPTLTASDLVMNYGDGSQFKAYLVNGQGNPYPGQTVQFNINGVFYNRVTNSNGIASLNINLARGTYIITSSNNGLSISNHIYVN